MFSIAAAFILAFAAMAVCAIFPLGSRTALPDTVADDPKPDADLRSLPKPRFLSVEGRNINGRKIRLPQQFECLYNVALITYDVDQLVDSAAWSATLRTIENTYPDIRSYQLSFASKLPWLTSERREFRRSSDAALQQTSTDSISLYSDPLAFDGVLGIEGRAHIAILLVDRFGNVVWRERGPCTGAKIEDLENTIINLLTNVRIYAEQ